MSGTTIQHVIRCIRVLEVHWLQVASRLFLQMCTAPIRYLRGQQSSWGGVVSFVLAVASKRPSVCRGGGGFCSRPSLRTCPILIARRVSRSTSRNQQFAKINTTLSLTIMDFCILILNTNGHYSSVHNGMLLTGDRSFGPSQGLFRTGMAVSWPTIIRRLVVSWLTVSHRLVVSWLTISHRLIVSCQTISRRLVVGWRLVISWLGTTVC